MVGCSPERRSVFRDVFLGTCGGIEAALVNLAECRIDFWGLAAYSIADFAELAVSETDEYLVGGAQS
jgi:hypothetical protein